MTVDSLRLLAKLGSYPTSPTDGTVLIATGDTTLIAGDYPMNAPTDTTYYYSLFHKALNSAWSSQVNQDTALVDSIGSVGGLITDNFNYSDGALSSNANWNNGYNGGINVSSNTVVGGQASDYAFDYYNTTSNNEL